MTIHLSFSTSDLLLLAAGLALLILILLLLVFGAKPRNQINISQNGDHNNADVSINQSQTIVTKVKVVRESPRQQRAAPTQSRSGRESSGDARSLFVIAGFALIVVAVLFVKHFDAIAFWTRTFSAAVVLLCVAMLVIYVLCADHPEWRDYLHFFPPLVGSMIGFGLMTEAQDLISAELMQAARSIPDGIPGLIQFYTRGLTDYGRTITLVAPIATFLMVFHALYAGLASIRAYGQAFHADADEKSLSSRLLDATDWCATEMYLFIGALLLCGGFYFGHWMPAHAIAA